MNQTILPIFAALALIIPFKVSAQDAASSPTQEAGSSASDYVSRAEYDKLKAEHEALKKEMDALKTTVLQMANGTVPAIPAEGPSTAKTAAPEGKQVITSTSSPPATDELLQQFETLKTHV